MQFIMFKLAIYLAFELLKPARKRKHFALRKIKIDTNVYFFIIGHKRASASEPFKSDCSVKLNKKTAVKSV